MKQIIGFLSIWTVLLGAALADGICLNFNGKHSSIAGFIDDKVLFVSPKDFLPTLGSSIIKIEPNEVTVRLCDKIFKLPFVVRDSLPYVNGVLTATTLGYKAAQSDLMLNVTGSIPECKPPAQPPKP